MQARQAEDPAVAATGRKGSVVWARDERGEMPARRFYSKLPLSDQAKAMALFERFAEYGTIVNKEKFRHLTGEGLVEFKIWGVRFIGGIVGNNVFIVGHAVKKKKSGSLRSSEFEKARRLLELNTLRYSGVDSDVAN